MIDADTYLHKIMYTYLNAMLYRSRRPDTGVHILYLQSRHGNDNWRSVPLVDCNMNIWTHWIYALDGVAHVFIDIDAKVRCELENLNGIVCAIELNIV